MSTHLLHHVDLVADAIEERRDEVEAGLADADETAEVLDRIAIALVDDLHADHHVERARTATAIMNVVSISSPNASLRSYCCERRRNERKIGVSFDLFEVRSVLFLPASNPRAIAKARDSAADLVVLDLEDAVKPADKTAARDAAVGRRGVGLAHAGCDPDQRRSALNGIRSISMPLPDRMRTSPSCRGPRRRISAAKSARRSRKPLLAMIETATGVLGSAGYCA